MHTTYSIQETYKDARTTVLILNAYLHVYNIYQIKTNELIDILDICTIHKKGFLQIMIIWGSYACIFKK